MVEDWRERGQKRSVPCTGKGTCREAFHNDEGAGGVRGSRAV